jgi:hypothetical protein
LKLRAAPTPHSPHAAARPDYFDTGHGAGPSVGGVALVAGGGGGLVAAAGCGDGAGGVWVVVTVVVVVVVVPGFE